jgi:hypothetical protein
MQNNLGFSRIYFSIVSNLFLVVTTSFPSNSPYGNRYIENLLINITHLIKVIFKLIICNLNTFGMLFENPSRDLFFSISTFEMTKKMSKINSIINITLSCAGKLMEVDNFQIRHF